MSSYIILTRSFNFEAAHSIHAPTKHSIDYANIHGHSFSASLSLKQPQNKVENWLMDFAGFDAIIEQLRSELDHVYLNKIEALGVPSLENLCAYVFKKAKAQLPDLYAVEVSRPSCAQSCRLEVNTD